MGLNIVWSPQASLSFDNIIVYLETQWTEREAKKFFKKTFKILNLLEAGNVNFQKLDDKDIYFVVITKQVKLFYQIENDSIHLLDFWDTRQDPENIEF